MHFNASLSSKIWQEASWFPEKSHGKNASPSEQKVPLSKNMYDAHVVKQ